MYFIKKDNYTPYNTFEDNRKYLVHLQLSILWHTASGYLMGLGHAKLEENRRKNKRTSLPVAGCDWGDQWINVGESWGDGCEEPKCECMDTGDIHCSIHFNGCK